MTAELSGKWSWTMFPYMRGVIDAFLEPGLKGVRCMKSSQAGWSETLATLIGFIIDVMPAPIIVLFPKEKKAKEFNLERFEPMVTATPCLADKVPLKSREKGITQTFKLFAGGWCKFVHSHSADEVKSSSARYAFVEEPDECERDVRGQGSTPKLLMERMKWFFDSFSVMGGSPTVEGLSTIADEMELTDKRKWFVPCPYCEVPFPLDGQTFLTQVKWPEDDARNHPVYGKAVTERASIQCPHCRENLTDAQRVQAVRKADELQRAGVGGVGWIATAPRTDLAGLYISDLMSCAPNATLQVVVEKYLDAKHKEASGDVSALALFYNNQLGLAFKYKSPAPAIEELEARSEDYAELTVPWPALRLTAGVDVQGNRIAIVVVAWGRGEESWRVYWGELHGNPVDHNDAVWTELERFLFRPYRHASGAELHIEAASIDAADGNTSDAVYHFCRKHRHHGVMAIRGVETGEIYRVPRPIDPARKTKASRYGLHVYMVGTEKAKDLIIGFGEHGGKLRLSERNDKGNLVTGRGPGRMHWYREIRGDYFKQLTSEIKAPRKGSPRNKLYWDVKTGHRNEALDCEVYALHAARSLKINLMTEAQWSAVEEQLRQPDLLARAEQGERGETPAAVPVSADDESNRDTAAREEARDGAQPENTPVAPPRAPRPAVDPLLAQLGSQFGSGPSIAPKSTTPY